MWGVSDRGLLRPGAFADVNVIDYDRLDLRLPEIRHEFPAGATHLNQGAVGYDATIVNGRVLMRDGQHTGAFPGRVVRG
jgi:N-acyl-D-aspartate/D-glutamate deacylase